MDFWKLIRLAKTWRNMKKKTDKHSATFISKSRVDTVHLHNQAHEIQI